MMDYEMFLGTVREKFMDYMPERFRRGKMEIRAVTKVNTTLDALTIRMPENERISPNIYVNEMYEQYKKVGNLDATLHLMAAEYTEILDETMAMKPELDIDDLKDNVIFILVNTEQNRELLANVPSKPFQDLSVIFRWVMSQDERGMVGSIVTTSMMKAAGLTAESLMEHAIENTKRICPPKIISMQKAMLEVNPENFEPELVELLEQMEEDPKETTWIITNESGINGASAMLYEENLHKLAEKMGTDMYLLPSSIHEWLAVSVDNEKPEVLADRVQEINRNHIRLEERLSNNVYHYDKDLRKVTMATDVPNKRLDGFVSEQPIIYDAERKR
ncbi:MAG: hypothetical protein K2L07_12400 [Lachnospiraceae bacterium]|nr:hypothetical protein [Lachnospiraceae bacterium]